MVISSKEKFVVTILSSGIVTRLSEVWLSEVYRLVTTYDILTKAGYKLEAPETNRALISILSESMYTNHLGRNGDGEKASKFILSGVEHDNLPPAKKEGMKFARKLLFATWDSVLEILGVPLDTSKKIIGRFSP